MTPLIQKHKHAHKHMQTNFQKTLHKILKYIVLKMNQNVGNITNTRIKINASCFKYFLCNRKHTININTCIISFLNSILNYHLDIPVRIITFKIDVNFIHDLIAPRFEFVYLKYISLYTKNIQKYTSRLLAKFLDGLFITTREQGTQKNSDMKINKKENERQKILKIIFEV